MKLSEDEARRRLVDADHGVLCTLHRDRGADAVPVVFAVDPDVGLGVPIDRVKPKSSSRLQRERNLADDPRATLLVEHWQRDDWSRLWWVRAELRWEPHAAERADLLGSLLASRFDQYRHRPFDRVLVFDVVAISGWAAADA